MKVIDTLKSMSTKELADFLHNEISSGDCCDCVLNNLDIMDKYCNKDDTCSQSIEKFLQSEEKINRW